ncbi:MAG: hypothetical protein K2H75_03210, partial [Muribaculaceae bacterium]|nr:hypothetical protein [Muribaculaceae bacterium]
MKEINFVASDIVSTQKSTKIARPKSILEAIEHIVTLAKESKFKEEFFAEALPYTRYLSRKLKLSIMQAILLSIFVDQSDNEHIRLSDIGRFINCSTTRLLRLTDDIEVLERLRYIRASYGHRVRYHVPVKVLKALCKNQPYIHEEMPVRDAKSFFDCFNNLQNEKEKDELTYDSLKTQTLELLDKIKSTHFALSLSKLKLDEDDRVLFIFIANRFVQVSDDFIVFSDIADLYDDNEIPGWCKHKLSSRESALFKENLIENVNEDGISRHTAFKLTEWAKEELLGELRLSAGNSDYGLMKYDTITEKKLIYNSLEGSQIKELSSLLAADRFRDIQTRFRKAGMRPGLSCLFYGAPGTGKTETLYKLARQ